MDHLRQMKPPHFLPLLEILQVVSEASNKFKLMRFGNWTGIIMSISTFTTALICSLASASNGGSQLSIGRKPLMNVSKRFKGFGGGHSSSLESN